MMRNLWDYFNFNVMPWTIWEPWEVPFGSLRIMFLQFLFPFHVKREVEHAKR